MRVQKSLVAGMIAGSLAFSAGPVFALAWDWPYPSADPKAAAQDDRAVRGETHASESGRAQIEFASGRGVIEKSSSLNTADKNALKDYRAAFDDDRGLDRDRRDH